MKPKQVEPSLDQRHFVNPQATHAAQAAALKMFMCEAVQLSSSRQWQASERRSTSTGHRRRLRCDRHVTQKRRAQRLLLSRQFSHSGRLAQAGTPAFFRDREIYSFHTIDMAFRRPTSL